MKSQISSLLFLGVLGVSAFIPPPSRAAPDADRLPVEIRPGGPDSSSIIHVLGRERSADELQLVIRRERDERPGLLVAFRLDGRADYQTFYAALSACYNVNLPAVTIETFEPEGPAGKPDGPLTFKMPARPGTDGRPVGFRPEVNVRLYREGDRVVAYAFGREKLPLAELKPVVAEGLRVAGESTLVLRAERDLSCRDVIAAYVLCREAGAGQVVFARAAP